MHRMTLLLPTPSVLWDRSLPEDVLFEYTMNQANFSETRQMLEVHEMEFDAYLTKHAENANESINRAFKMLGGKDEKEIEEAIRILSSIILRAPRTSTLLCTALKLRANWFYVKCCFEGAAADYEMYLYIIGKQEMFKEDICEVSGNLTICYYFMRQYKIAKKYYDNYQQFRDGISDEILCQDVFLQINNNINRFANELENLEEVVPEVINEIEFSIPFQGFNKSDDIPLTSKSCKYVKGSTSSRPSGVYAQSTIPKTYTVLVEHPPLRHLKTPMVRCEVCFRQRPQVYTCLNCRYKTYCSILCMDNDLEEHKVECPGYRSLILILLDACHLHRLFTRVSYLLYERLFHLPEFRECKSAGDVLKTVETLIADNRIGNSPYLKLLNIKPDYSLFSEQEYATLVATAFRVTVFVESRTFSIESYYQMLKISNKQKMVLVGVILMRLSVHLLNNTFDFEQEYRLELCKQNKEMVSTRQQVEQLIYGIKPVSSVEMGNINKYYKIDVEKEILKSSNELLKDDDPIEIALSGYPSIFDSAACCDRIRRSISIYGDHIIEMIFTPHYEKMFQTDDISSRQLTVAPGSILCASISELLTYQRLKFAKRFAYLFHLYLTNYFIHPKKEVIDETISLVCTTLKKFRHSCAPNVEIIILNSGVILGKALRNIKQGEELVVSYKAHYMLHSRTERKRFLEKLKLNCVCEYCTMPESSEPLNKRHGLKCEKCKDKIILSTDKMCEKCHTYFKTLSFKYYTSIKALDNLFACKINNQAEEREIYVSLLMFYLFVKKSLAPSCEVRIKYELRFAKFLALKNCAQQAYNIIMEIKANALQHYTEQILWFTMYADILLIIKIIIHYHLEQWHISIPTNCVEELWRFGYDIINGQKDHLQLYETFDNHGAAVLEDLRTFIEWRGLLSCKDILPLADSMCNWICIHGEKLDMIPALSKCTY